MALTRRQFLTLMGGSAGAAVLFQACGLPEKELLIDSPAAMPEDLVSGIDNWYATASQQGGCLLYTSPSPRDGLLSRMPSSA